MLLCEIINRRAPRWFRRRRVEHWRAASAIRLNNAARRLETVPAAAPLLELWRMQSEMNRVFSGFSAAAAQIFASQQPA